MATIPSARPRVLALALLGAALVLAGCLASASGDVPTTATVSNAASGADPLQRTWQRTDKPVADGAVARSWVWGPQPFATTAEDYVESPGGRRQVVYYDKSRMEVSDPAADPASPWYVTNGLLATELITGRLQLGDDRFERRAPATIPIAGDPDDASGPTYATLAPLLNAHALADGAPIVQRLARDGSVRVDDAIAARGATAAQRVTVPGIDHQVASPFWAFMNASGPVWQGGALVEAALFENPFYATGYPISEAYWTTVRVGGTPRDVLLQCFERRCLTWTPDNPPGWQVELGNIGRHYHAWRYPDAPAPTATPTAAAAMTPTTTATATVPATPTGTAGTPELVEIGPGALDAWMRSLVRDRAGRLWLVAMNNNAANAGSGPGELRLYRATAPGIPSAFAEVVPARITATGSAAIPFADAAIDGEDRLHVVWVDRGGPGQPLWYRIFDLAGERWLDPPELIDTTGLSGFGGNAGQGGASIALASDETLRVAYAAADNHTQIRVRQRGADGWGAADEPLRVESAFVWHPALAWHAGRWMLAAYDATNRAILASIDAGAGWTLAATVADDVLGPENIDQGPAVAGAADGSLWLLWLDADSFLRLGSFDGTAWSDVPLGGDYYTHAPGLGIFAGGTLAIAGHDHHSPPTALNQLQGQPGAWGAWQPLVRLAADGSQVFRWAGAFSTPGTTLDLAFFDEDTNDDGAFDDQTLYYLAVPIE